MTDFDAYVESAWPRLVRSAWLLTGDWHRAEDLGAGPCLRSVAEHPPRVA